MRRNGSADRRRARHGRRPSRARAHRDAHRRRLRDRRQRRRLADARVRARGLRARRSASSRSRRRSTSASRRSCSSPTRTASPASTSTDDELQVAQGSPVTDGDGTRRATLLLEPGTEATATLPDGTEQGARRPAEHPRHRVHDRRQRPGRDARRAAADLRLHVRGRVLGRRGLGTDQAVDVEFDKPIVTYVDNFVGFAAGTPVPMGYYDREKAQWIPAPGRRRDRDRRRGGRPRAARRRPATASPTARRG